MATIYKFEVGTKNILNIDGRPLRFLGYNNAVDRDSLEYTPNKLKAYKRDKIIGRDISFDWNLL